MSDPRITNITTALMTIRDMAQYSDVAITIDFLNDFYITVYVGANGDKNMARFYLQDLYRYESKKDSIRDFIEKAIEDLKKDSRE